MIDPSQVFKNEKNVTSCNLCFKEFEFDAYEVSMEGDFDYMHSAPSIQYSTQCKHCGYPTFLEQKYIEGGQ